MGDSKLHGDGVAYSIGDTFLFYATTKEIWDAVTLAYLDLQDSSQVFELSNRARDLMQANQTVTQYFNSLKKLWQELDLFNNLAWKDPKDGIMYNRMLARDRVYDFLAGLNKDLDAVHSRLSGLKPVPSIDEAFAEVRCKESRKHVMLGNHRDSLTSGANSSAMAAKIDSRPTKKGQVWCDHCQKTYHTGTHVGSFMENLQIGLRNLVVVTARVFKLQTMLIRKSQSHPFLSPRSKWSTLASFSRALQLLVPFSWHKKVPH